MATMNVRVDDLAKEQRLPSDVGIDPFYSPENITELEHAAADIAAGRNCHEHELIEG